MTGWELQRWQKRVLSGLILAPVVAAIIWQGGFVFLAFLLLAAALCLWEWFFLAARSAHKFLFVGIGSFYIGFSFWICYRIRMDYSAKIALLFIAMIWASDIGAYIAGKTFGGPKLAPRISPNKTWAGLIGAMVAPSLTGGLYIYLYSLAAGHGLSATALGHVMFLFVILGSAIGFVGQTGDLLISVFKRYVSVKDAGNLIPGHGGLLDRVDALMLSAPVYMFMIPRFIHALMQG